LTDRPEVNLEPSDFIIDVTRVSEVRDQTPHVVYAILPEVQMDFWFWRTMYQIFNERQNLRVQRNQLQRTINLTMNCQLPPPIESGFGIETSWSSYPNGPITSPTTFLVAMSRV
jgi:hypothetical protein